MEDEKKTLRVVALLSLPRLAFTDNMFCAVQAVHKTGIPMWSHTGAFWQKSLSKLLYKAVSKDVDYVITIDYDTVFTGDDLWTLLRLCAFHDDVAAVFPVQYKRDSPSIICTMQDQGGGQRRDLPASEANETELIDASAGHFGLTAIDVKKLMTVPQPWLMCVPNHHGCWGDDQVGEVDPGFAKMVPALNGGRSGRNSIDSDIYFWTRLQDHGHRVCLAPQVRVGHVESTITTPDENLQKVELAPPIQHGDDVAEVSHAAC